MWRFLKNEHLPVMLHSGRGIFAQSATILNWMNWKEIPMLLACKGYFSLNDFYAWAACNRQNLKGIIIIMAGSCRPLSIGKTLSMSWTFTHWTHQKWSKIAEWEIIAFIGTECLKYSLRFGLQTNWKLAFKEQNFSSFPL